METNARDHSSLFTCHEINFSCLSPTLQLLLLLPLLLLLLSWLTMFLNIIHKTWIRYTLYFSEKCRWWNYSKKSQNLHIHSMAKWFFIISTLNRISSPILTSHNLLLSLKGTNANSSTILLTLWTPGIGT
jgi:hypothetical protein